MNIRKFFHPITLAVGLLAGNPILADALPATLVMAPDRGFMGNEEVRAAFEGIDQANKQLVFVTDPESRAYLDAAVAELTGDGATDLLVLPFFVSGHNPNWSLAESWLLDDICGAQLACEFSNAFGRSYLAVDLLDEALIRVAEPNGKRLVLVGAGASNDTEAARMAAGLETIASWTTHGAMFDSISATIWTDDADDEEQSERLRSLGAREDTVIVGFNLGWKLDSMMSFDAMLERRLLSESVNDFINAGIDRAMTATWMQREVNRRLIRSAADLGVVIQAHGSDFHWNQTMRDAVAPLHGNYAVEYAFSMADRPSIEAALMRLEERGLRGAVVVRIFGRASSFRSTIETMLGMDIENSNGLPRHHGHAPPGQMMMMGGGRIRTPLVVTSAGGLEDHPLFAEALLARALDLSEDPASETVILVAHGLGDDEGNAEWLELLDSLANQMTALGGDSFRAIRFGTWREDWPDKRDEWIERMREMVEVAQQDGGRALVIPARTNATGPEERLLEGLDFELGEGFAPHPLFVRWVESQAEAGYENLTRHPARTVPH